MSDQTAEGCGCEPNEICACATGDSCASCPQSVSGDCC